MSEDSKNSMEELQERLKRLKSEYEAANPGSSFEDLIKLEETEPDMAEYLNSSTQSEKLSITELFVALRADYEAELESGEERITNSIQANIFTLIKRQQIEKLREEYADDEMFLGYINQIAQEMALCMRVYDEVKQTRKLDDEITS